MRLLFTSLCLAVVLPNPAWAAEDFTGTKIEASLGKREVILESGRYGLKCFPDECLAFVQIMPTIRLLMAAGVSTSLLEGRDMRSLVLRGLVLKPGKPGSFDNGRITLLANRSHSRLLNRR